VIPGLCAGIVSPSQESRPPLKSALKKHANTSSSSALPAPELLDGEGDCIAATSRVRFVICLLVPVLGIRIRIRIRICMDPRHFGNLDPHPHHIRIRSGSAFKVITWIRNRIRINLQMTSPCVWNMSLFEHFFKGLSLSLEARIWTRTRIPIRVKSRIRTFIHIHIK
jgi:hypothetical protein